MRLFLIAKDQFLINIFKNTFEEFYFLDSFDDVSFRVPDFRPDLILVSGELIEPGAQRWSEIIAIASQIPVFALCFEDKKRELEAEGWEGGFLLKPLELARLKESVSELLIKKH